MLKQSDNILHRLFSRETCRAVPNTHIHRARQLYENVVPSDTLYDIEHPDHIFRKFTNDGQYLICFSRNCEDLIVYRFNWLSYCTEGPDSDINEELPLKAKQFESFFIKLYTLTLGSATELICQDFFLSAENSSFGIFATRTGPDSDAPATPGAPPGVPSIERIALHLVRLADGVVVDERVYRDDFIHLSHNAGVCMYDDLLAILSIKYQSIHIVQIRETGMFVDVRTIGTSCREDDELVINSQEQEEILFQRHATAQKVKSIPSEVGFSLALNPHEIKGKALVSQCISRGLDPVVRAAYHDQNNMIQRGVESLGTDIDIQYEGYFGGLFGSPESSGGSQNEGFVRRFSAEFSPKLKSSFSPTRLEAPDMFPVNPGMEALSSNNRAGSLPSTTGGCDIGIQIGTSRCSNLPDRNSAINGYERNIIVGEESENLGITKQIGVCFDCGSTNMGSSNGSECGFRNLCVHGGGNSYAEPSEASSIGHSSERNVRYIVSSRSLCSPQQYGSVKELMQTGSSPVAFASVTGYDRFAVQRQIGETSVIERLSCSVEGPDDTRSAIDLESTHRSTILLDLGSTRFPHRTADYPDDVVTTAPVSTVNARWRFDTPHSRQRLHHVGENVLSLPVREGQTSERAVQELYRPGNQLLGGIKQRLLSFLFESLWNQDTNPVFKGQQMKRFYYHFQHYVDLVIQKVQFLDRFHLLIKFGDAESVVSRHSNASSRTSFLAIYNMETTKMLEFQQNSSNSFLKSFEHFYDHFRIVPRSYISSHSNNAFSREQYQKQKSAYQNKKPGNSSRVVRMTLDSLPFCSQSQSPSVYFDQSLFHFDEKVWNLDQMMESKGWFLFFSTPYFHLLFLFSIPLSNHQLLIFTLENEELLKRAA
ncbi:hypothetical protein O6H91_03G055000 [Diphasiastrum complanatum]|uniref:Uncharacterized protein n=1 Tax=Diphasiastrum complanatum TaxID=34168 RepID=A0ACC2E6G4_DIPCM|nr:hypothetical protein O6H91_03G055000 [Diphasiastrum complanatum]